VLPRFGAAFEAAGKVHDPGLGVAVGRDRPAEAEQLLPAARRTPVGGLYGLSGPVAGQDRPAGLEGLTDGLRVGVGHVPFAMGTPELAGELVKARAHAGARDGFEDLVD
jgi:hypothetical protein